MSKGFNLSILLGNLGKDPRMAYTVDGLPICNFDIATSERFKSKNEWQERTEWHRIVVFGTFAEVCGSKLRKGSQAFVTGRKQTRDYKVKDGDGKETGEVRKVVEVIAQNVTFCGKAPVMPQSQVDIPDRIDGPPPGPGDDDIPF